VFAALAKYVTGVWNWNQAERKGMGTTQPADLEVDLHGGCELYFMDAARIWPGAHRCNGISCSTWCDMGVLDLVGGIWFPFTQEG
jgi:hypothetical protein